MKRFLVTCSAACGALVLVSALSAQTAAPVPLSVEQAVASALEKNVSVQRSAISLGTLKRESTFVWNNFLPSVSAGAGSSKANDADYWSMYGTINASLSLSPALVQAVRATKLSYEAGQISYETARRSIELSVRKAYYTLLLEKENLTLTEKSLATAQSQFDQTDAKRRVGQASELDLLQAQVTLENIKPTLASAKVTLLGDLATFKQSLGIPQDSEISFTGTMDEALPKAVVEKPAAAGESLSVTALRKSLEVAEITRSLTLSQNLLPSLSLSYSYQPAKTTREGAEWADAGSFSATVTLPLNGFLPFTSKGVAMAATKDTIRDIELQLSNARLSSEITTKNLLQKIEQALTSLKALRLNVQLAEKSYEMTEDAYRKGTKTLLDLQNAGDSRDEARVEVLKESYTLIAAVLDLEYETNVPFGTLGR